MTIKFVNECLLRLIVKGVSAKGSGDEIVEFFTLFVSFIGQALYKALGTTSTPQDTRGQGSFWK